MICLSAAATKHLSIAATHLVLFLQLGAGTLFGGLLVARDVRAVHFLPLAPCVPPRGAFDARASLFVVVVVVVVVGGGGIFRALRTFEVLTYSTLACQFSRPPTCE